MPADATKPYGESVKKEPSNGGIEERPDEVAREKKTQRGVLKREMQK